MTNTNKTHIMGSPTLGRIWKDIVAPSVNRSIRMAPLRVLQPQRLHMALNNLTLYHFGKHIGGILGPFQFLVTHFVVSGPLLDP